MRATSTITKSRPVPTGNRVVLHPGPERPRPVERLHHLDYLRGLAAFGIMLYHYLSWTQGELPAGTFLGRVGIYGVSLFYMLSGLTLFVVYQQRMAPSGGELVDFFRKRFFRIFPLLWVATACSILLSRKLPDGTDLFLSLSGLFGLVQWDAYLATGAWSIGNELVFYLFFPVFVFLGHHSRWGLSALTLLLFGVYVYFAFSVLEERQLLSRQWIYYIHPLNQVFLFLGGFLIGMVGRRVQVSQAVSLGLLAATLGLFILYPVKGDVIHLVTGWNRLVFTLLCLVICFSFYRLSLTLPALLHRPLARLGEASYSVYLLHPLVFVGVKTVFGLAAKQGVAVPAEAVVVVSIGASLVASWWVYEYFEKYFMKLGRRVVFPPQSHAK